MRPSTDYTFRNMNEMLKKQQKEEEEEKKEEEEEEEEEYDEEEDDEEDDEGKGKEKGKEEEKEFPPGLLPMGDSELPLWLSNEIKDVMTVDDYDNISSLLYDYEYHLIKAEVLKKPEYIPVVIALILLGEGSNGLDSIYSFAVDADVYENPMDMILDIMKTSDPDISHKTHELIDQWISQTELPEVAQYTSKVKSVLDGDLTPFIKDKEEVEKREEKAKRIQREWKNKKEEKEEKEEEEEKERDSENEEDTNVDWKDYVPPQGEFDDDEEEEDEEE